MKTTFHRYLIVPGLLTLALAFATLTLTAQVNEPKKTKAVGKAAMKKYDANGDHQLDEAETAKLKADDKARRDAQKAENLARYDADNNGKLSKEETAKMKADREAVRETAKAAKEAKEAKKAASGTGSK